MYSLRVAINRQEEDLNALEQWSHKWQMLCNSKKCEFLRITFSLALLDHFFSFYIPRPNIKGKKVV